MFESFQSVIGHAVIDTEFRKGLLNGKRRYLLDDFNLSPEEVEFAMGIRADSIEEFACQIDSWISRSQGIIEPPALAVLLSRGKRGIPFITTHLPD